jgi:SAM-dependent methyltransferase
VTSVITAAQDAFGTSLQDSLMGRRGHDLILERDDGWSCEAMPPDAFLARPESWANAERQILRHVASGPVLDLGCGGGRHALYFQDLGLDVTAVDVSPGAIEVSRKRGVRDARLLDLRSPPDDQPWGSVLMMCGNLGLGGSWAETRELLALLSERSAPGAVLIGDTVDPTQTDEPAHLRYQAANRSAGRHVGEVTLRLRYGDLVSPWWRLVNVPESDVAELVAETGWTLAKHLRDGADQYVALRKEDADAAA